MNRKVEVMIDGIWERCQLRQVLPGALIRMYEPDGTPVRDHKGRTEFKVTSRARRENGVWAVDVED